MAAPTSICLVAILKDETSFLDEWLVYHRMMGIDHFFLYDDDPTQPLRDFLTPHTDYLTVINWWQSTAKGRQGNQIAAYNHAIKNYITPYEWVAFLDGDEFIVLRQHSTINEFLSDFKNEVSVSLNWHVFGHNGFFNDPNRLITSSLNRRKHDPYPDVKTITKTTAILTINHSHYSQLKYGERVDANHRRYTGEVYEGKTDIAHINHYLCRSFNNWMKRVDRGDVNFIPGSRPNEEWRFEEERCLERFVSIISRDNNEYVDNFMLQYKYDIHEKINRLNRNKVPVIKDFLNIEQQTAIETQLKLIAEFLILNAARLNNIGLFNGKSGIAVFLFHYSRFTTDPQYQQFAIKLLDNIADEITEDSPVNYNDGLAGYGVMVEHLAAESFIKIDTDEFLEDIDVLINHHFITNQLSDPDFYKNIIGISKYYLSRFNNPLNFPYHHTEPKNRQILEDIIPLINSPSNSCHENLIFLDFLCGFYPHRENRSQAEKQIRQLSATIKNSVDNADSQKFKKFNPLYAAEILLKFSKKVKDDFYHKLASDILHDHEDDYWQYISKRALAVNYNPGIGLHYLHLAKMLNKPTFIEKGLDYLKNEIMDTDDYEKFINANDIKKIVGGGLILLIMATDWSENLFDLSFLFTAEFDGIIQNIKSV